MIPLNATAMTEGDLRALRLLIAQPGLVRPGHFGDLLWGEGGYSGTACSAPYARPAGKVLNRLRSGKFAEWVHEGSDWGWRATSFGRRILGDETS